jgi:transposase-like protein
MARVVPGERFRRELDEVLAGVDGEADPLERIGRLGPRLILQQALEDEVTEFLGRVRYERAEEAVSYRNGYEPRRVVTTAGPVELERPRVRNARELGFESRILGRHVARTCALESLIICCSCAGCRCATSRRRWRRPSTRPRSASRPSRGSARTRASASGAGERRLDEHDLVYLFLDALYLKLRPDDEPAEGVLVAWGVTLEGRKVLLGLALGSRESYENWLAFGRDLTDRGLRSPALIVADGAPGIWKAARDLWPSAEEQRCTVHALRNVTGKLPERHHRELSRDSRSIDSSAVSTGIPLQNGRKAK